MNEGELPPIMVPPILGETPPPLEPPKPKWRWAVFLFLVAGYVLGVGLIGAHFRSEDPAGGAALPSDVSGLFQLARWSLGYSDSSSRSPGCSRGPAPISSS